MRGAGPVRAGAGVFAVPRLLADRLHPAALHPLGCSDQLHARQSAHRVEGHCACERADCRESLSCCRDRQRHADDSNECERAERDTYYLENCGHSRHLLYFAT